MADPINEEESESLPGNRLVSALGIEENPQTEEPRTEAQTINAESRLTDREILAAHGYEIGSANPVAALASSRVGRAVGGFFGRIGNFFRTNPTIQRIRNSPVGRATGYVLGKVNQALNHPAGKLVTFGLAVTLGGLAVAGTGGAALVLPAIALGATVGGKVIGGAFKAQHENKMRSLRHQLDLLRTLNRETAEHGRTMQQIRDRMPPEKKEELDEHVAAAAEVDEHRAVAAGGQVHTRNLPTLRNETAKVVGANALRAVGGAIEVSSMPATAAHLARHAPDAVSQGLGTHERAHIANEVTEELRGSDQEAALKLRINRLSQDLRVPPASNTAELTSHVRGRLGSMRAEERMATDVAEGRSTSPDQSAKAFRQYKEEAKDNKTLDLQVSRQKQRGGFSTRIAHRMAEAVVGSPQEWVGSEPKTPDATPPTPAASRRRARGTGVSV